MAQIYMHLGTKIIKIIKMTNFFFTIHTSRYKNIQVHNNKDKKLFTTHKVPYKNIQQTYYNKDKLTIPISH